MNNCIGVYRDLIKIGYLGRRQDWMTLHDSPFENPTSRKDMNWCMVKILKNLNESVYKFVVETRPEGS